jgi:hypothetical protein
MLQIHVFSSLIGIRSAKVSSVDRSPNIAEGAKPGADVEAAADRIGAAWSAFGK